MNRLFVKKDVQLELRDYMKRTFTVKHDQEELAEFLEEMRPGLRQEITAKIFRNVLIKSKSFKELRILMREVHKIKMHAAQLSAHRHSKFTEDRDTRFHEVVDSIVNNIVLKNSTPDYKVIY